MNRNRFMRLIVLVGAAWGLSTATLGAAEGKGHEQTKIGTVKKVDADGKQMVVMVTRELTFTVTEETKIVKADKPAKLADIKVEAKVSVVYVKDGETRTAHRIAILSEN